MNASIIIASLACALWTSTPADLAGSGANNPLRPELLQYLKVLPECRARSVLTEITERFPDVTCPTGGKLVFVGIDDDRDGRLDPPEIQDVIELCDDARIEKLDALREQDACLHVEVASALRFSLQLERALAPEQRDTPAELLRELPRYPNDS